MSQTLVTLNTKLTAHAATANANKFIMGYIEDVHLLRRQDITYYPIIMVLPPVLGQLHNTDIAERKTILDITVFYEFPRNVNDFTENYVTERIVKWKLANDIGIAFIQAIDGDTNITILDDEFEANYIPEGTTMENTVAVNYKINVKVSC